MYSHALLGRTLINPLTSTSVSPKSFNANSNFKNLVPEILLSFLPWIWTFLYKVASNARELQSTLRHCISRSQRSFTLTALTKIVNFHLSVLLQLKPLASKFPLWNPKVLFFVLRVKKISLSLSFVWPLYEKEAKALCNGEMERSLTFSKSFR